MLLTALLTAAQLASASSILDLVTIPSSQVAPDSIYLHLKADYSEATRSLDLRAVFREGGATGGTVELVAPASIGLEAIEKGRTVVRPIPTLKHWYGTTVYRSLIGGVLVPSHTAVFKDPTGRVFRNTLTLRRASIEKPRESLKRASGATLKLIADAADPASGADTISVELTDSKYQVVSHDVAEGETAVSFTADELATLSPGTVKIRVTRSGGGDLAQTTSAGGRSSWVYLGAEVAAKLE